MKILMKQKSLRWLTIVGVIATLTGCGADQRELQVYIDRIKARPGGAIEPLPAISPPPSYKYVPGDRRSPFRPDTPLEILTANPNAVNGPDPNRPKEHLESQPLDALTMVGTLRSAAGQYGLVQEPDGRVHRITIGNHMGHNYGRVVGITESQIELVEIVPDMLGGYIERPANIGLSD